MQHPGAIAICRSTSHLIGNGLARLSVYLIVTHESAETFPGWPLALTSGQLFEQGFRFLKVGGVEAFSERFVNW